MDIKLQVAKIVYQALDGQISETEIFNVIEKPKHQDLGDLSFPTFILAKALKQAPQKIAEELAPKIQDELITKTEAVGPYINFFLNQAVVSNQVLTEIFTNKNDFGQMTFGEKRNITIDMSSPNIAKPMSMGHLRSTVIGNSLANIAEKVGFTPIRINHLGDWGTQFGKLIVAYKNWGNEANVLADPIGELLRLYVKFHQEAEEDPELDSLGREWFKKLEEGNEEALYLWNWFKSESLKEFNKVYEVLGIDFDSHNGEAFYNDKMGRVIDLLEEKQLLTVDNGATIVDLEKYKLNPALIKKSDGATLYMTRDLAAAIYRKENYDFAQSWYVVGNEQSNHFKQLISVLLEMGYDWANDIYHIPFGLITQGGKKLSTRKGKVILLEEVLDAAVELAKEQIDQKNPNLANKDEVAKQVGVGAVVFHDLKNDRLNNFDFVIEEVVQFEGETGPYVQYTHARAESILRKAGVQLTIDQSMTLEDAYSWEVIKELNAFPDNVLAAFEKREPSVIAKYSIRLAQAFNKYYANSKILVEDAERPARLALVKAVSEILKEALRLLGVNAPDEM